MKARRFIASAPLAALLALGLLPTASAGQADQVVVVKNRANNPRQLEAAPDGTVYVAEAGKGGKTCIKKQGCFGFTGKISSISPTGDVSVAHKGLLSYSGKDGSFATGADDLALGTDGSLYAIITSVGPKSPSKDAARQDGKLLALTGMDKRSAVADLVKFEIKNNPDGAQVESNPFSVLKDGDVWIVADAAANALNQVDAEGNVTNLAVFPDIRVEGKKRDAVPTSVAKGPDGAYYVGELGGEGNEKARVWRVVPGEAPTVYARGFTMIMGLDFGPDGSLYLVELVANAEAFSTFQGALQVIPPGADGAVTELAAGQLLAPGGVVVTDAGRIYVSNCSVFPGKTKDPSCHGQVVEVIPAG